MYLCQLLDTLKIFQYNISVNKIKEKIMKKKELRNLAKQIAKLERVIQENQDSTAVNDAKNAEIHLINKITDFSDMDLLDEMVQQYMQEEE